MNFQAGILESTLKWDFDFSTHFRTYRSTLGLMKPKIE